MALCHEVRTKLHVCKKLVEEYLRDDAGTGTVQRGGGHSQDAQPVGSACHLLLHKRRQRKYDDDGALE